MNSKVNLTQIKGSLDNSKEIDKEKDSFSIQNDKSNAEIDYNYNNQSHNENQNDKAIEIKTTLLQNLVKLGIDSRLAEEQYNKAETNFIISIDPKVIIFSGFVCDENKDYKQKALVINISKFSQRISIIPPTSPYFKIKFSRRGLIPSGLSETIYIYFTPQKYQYYYDFIRIHCEGSEQLTIPIHAYPVMNINKSPNYIPRFIDFNKVMINKTEERHITVTNIVTTAGFEFELIPIKSCSEIQIIPLFGEIPANGDFTITIKFTPQRYGVFLSDYDFRLSEFGFKPTRLSISGTCAIFDNSEQISEKISQSKNTNPFKEASNKIQYPQNKINKEKQDKIDKAAEHLKRLNIAEVKENPLFTNEIGLTSRKVSLSTKGMINLQGVNDLIFKKEKTYLEYFNNVSQKIKDKEIKYIQFTGKKLLEDYEIKSILSQRKLENDYLIEFNRKLDLQRYQVTLDSIKPSIQEGQEFIL